LKPATSLYLGVGFDEENHPDFRRHRTSGTSFEQICFHGKRLRLLSGRRLGLENSQVCSGGFEGGQGRRKKETENFHFCELVLKTEEVGT